MPSSDEREPRGPAAGQALSFAPFLLIRSQKLLLEDGRTVRLGGRAFDLLAELVERPGEVVTKAELVARVWPTTYVEENNLRVHLSALRKVLGDGRGGRRYIVNIAGRGYCFVAPVTRIDLGEPAAVPDVPVHANHRLLPSAVRMLGRDRMLAHLIETVRDERLVSVTGTGGQGKSTIALAAADALSKEFLHGAHMIDVAGIDEADQLPTEFAALFELSLPDTAGLSRLLDFLSTRELLLVIDNCDRLLDPIARLAEAILASAKDVTLLVTSREPLRVNGELILALPPLDLPQEQAATADEALGSAAVQLFVERAAAAMDGFRLSDDDAPAASLLCRRLDGNPLAIELAAARVDMLGVHGLASRLDDLFPILTAGLRNAAPRHRTLHALIDWSHDLLSRAEKTVLARLSVFRGGFTLDSAVATCAGGDLSAEDVLLAVVNLATKSLITTDISSDPVRHRLLDVTRSYALLKLSQRGEVEAVNRRLALHLLDVMEGSAAEWERLAPPEWRAAYSPFIDDLRASLAWTLEADPGLCLRLTAAAIPLPYQMSLFGEAQRWGELVLARIGEGPHPDRAAEVVVATAISGFGTQMLNTHAVEGYLRRVVSLAEPLESPVQKFGPLVAQWAHSFGIGDYRDAARLSEGLGALARISGDPSMSVTADRTMSQSLHYLGDHTRAARLAGRVLTAPGLSLPLSQSAAQVSRQVSMRIILARVLWIQGLPDQAAEMAAETVVRATADSPVALCQVLAMAFCPIALWRGEAETARAGIDRLQTHSEQINSGYWQSWAACYDLVLRRRQSAHSPTGGSLLPTVASKLSDMAATLAPEYLTPQSVARARSGVAGWSAPEVLRLEALSPAFRQKEAALPDLRAARALAQQQGALSWELRCATSLARLAECSAKQTALDNLSLVLDQFSEGQGTADLVAAANLLTERAP